MSPPCCTSPYEMLRASHGPQGQQAVLGSPCACRSSLHSLGHFTPALVLLEGLSRHSLSRRVQKWGRDGCLQCTRLVYSKHPLGCPEMSKARPECWHLASKNWGTGTEATQKSSSYCPGSMAYSCWSLAVDVSNIQSCLSFQIKAVDCRFNGNSDV